MTVSKTRLELNQRIIWVDYAKGIGIFLVVLGHVIRSFNKGSISNVPEFYSYIDQWIYAFHMPLFFFISGLFIERSASKNLNKFVVNKLQTIAYPYFVWSIVQEIIRHFAGIESENLGSLWKSIYQPILEFWFLYVLFLISLFYVLLRHLKVSIGLFFIISVLLYTVPILGINIGSWGVIYLVCSNLVYFALGALVQERNILFYLEKARPLFLIITSLLGFLIIAFASYFNLLKINYLTVFFAFIGIAASVFLAKYLEQFARSKFLKNWGFLSLQIYVAHTIFAALTRIILRKVFHINDLTINLFLGTLIGIYGPIILYNLCSKLNFDYAFVWPSSKEKKIKFN